VESANTRFGDPCDGTHKYLTVNYECKPGFSFSTSTMLLATQQTTSQQPTTQVNAALLNNKAPSNGTSVDMTAVVICVTIVSIVAIIACAVVVLRSRVRKRAELDYGSQVDVHSRGANYIVEGAVESVVGDDTLSFDPESEQQNVLAM
jgi:hypothetical protein